MREVFHRCALPCLLALGSLGWVRAQQAPAPVESYGKPAVIMATTGRAPWVGFEVARADDVVRAQLPKLPKGVGFVITSVAPQGPARQAGMQAYDVLWKWNDQLLINEAQLSALLEMQAIGDKVRLTLFRAGEEKTLEAILGAEPDLKAVAAGPTIESVKTPTMVPQLQSPRPLDVNSRVARLEDGNAVLEMESRSDGTWLTITDQQGETVFDGWFNDQAQKKIPAVWMDRVGALHRSLQDRLAPKSPAEETRPLPAPPADIKPVTPVSTTPR